MGAGEVVVVGRRRKRKSHRSTRLIRGWEGCDHMRVAMNDLAYPSFMKHAAVTLDGVISVVSLTGWASQIR